MNIPRKSSLLDSFDESQDAESPERWLMRAVIVNALDEATGRYINATPAKRAEIVCQARIWFERGGEDFQFVCSAAGLEPSAVQKGALSYIEYKDRHPKRKRAA